MRHFSWFRAARLAAIASHEIACARKPAGRHARAGSWKCRPRCHGAKHQGNQHAPFIAVGVSGSQSRVPAWGVGRRGGAGYCEAPTNTGRCDACDQVRSQCNSTLPWRQGGGKQRASARWRAGFTIIAASNLRTDQPLCWLMAVLHESADLGSDAPRRNQCLILPSPRHYQPAPQRHPAT